MKDPNGVWYYKGKDRFITADRKVVDKLVSDTRYRKYDSPSRPEGIVSKHRIAASRRWNEHIRDYIFGANEELDAKVRAAGG